jgi:hypothetical protein
MNKVNTCVIRVVFLSLVLGFFWPVYGAQYSLIRDRSNQDGFSSPSKTVRPSNFKKVHRSRPVNLAPIVKSQGRLLKGDLITLNLFDDKIYTARIDRISTNINGTVTVRGRIDHYPMGYLLISTTSNESLASIRIPEENRQYCIVNIPSDNAHYLFELDADGIEALEDSPSLIPPVYAMDQTQESEPIGAMGDEAADGPLDPANVDLMIVYTPAAMTWAGGASGIANVIAQAMAKAQLALDNSNTYLTLTLVHSAQVSYTESGSSSTDLDRLTYTSDGYMDEVHTWRNTYKADVVALFTKVEDTGGMAWLLRTLSGDPGRAFSLSRVQQVEWTYTMIHEIGHNMGCHHRKDQVTQPGPGLFSYSAGWRWIGNDSGKYCSVMSYEEDNYNREAYFSNPSILYQGVATGDAADGDNARTLRETKHVVAAYRLPTGSLQVTISPQAAVAAGAQWRRVGTTTWFNSGQTETDIAMGSHAVEFKDIPGWAKPANLPVSINENQLTEAFGIYTIAPEIIIGTGLQDWSYPLATFYHDARTQTLYLADEIGGAHNLNALALYVTDEPGQMMTNFTIRMKHTDLSVYGVSPIWESSGWTTVYQANQSITTTGWVQFNFTTPFVYNGTQNLMVDISFNNSSYTNDGRCRYSTPGGSRTISYRADSIPNNPDPLTWSNRTPTPESSTRVPNIKLVTTAPQQAAMPLFTPDGGTYDLPQQVTIDCNTPGAVIHYTTNGIDPNQSDPNIESGASILIDRNLTLKAGAWKTGLLPSGIKTAAYEIIVATPVFAPDGGTYSAGQSVTVTCDTPDVTIHYTTNGLDPNQSDPNIESGLSIFVDGHLTLKAKAWKTGLTPSPVKTAVYDIPMVIYVSGTGNDNNNGRSWMTAKQTVQGGLDMAFNGDEIWVAGGVYKPTLERDESGDRYKTFQLKNSVSLYGGFAGTETARDLRNWRTNPTILSGDLDGNGVFSGGDAYHVFYHPAGLNLDATAVLDGFVISGGYADASDDYGMGGGMCNIGSSPVLSNCVFEGNWGYVAGGMLNWSANPVIDNCIFINNAADSGGAIYNYENANPWIISCTISDNSAGGGGGIINDTSGNPVITNTILWGNNSSDGLQIVNYSSSPVVTYCDVEGGYAGSGNINLPPLFIDAGNGDLRLQTGSPCIDTGSNAAVGPASAMDLAGEPRIIDGNCDANSIVDIGAYEYYMVGDLNASCNVNADDFNQFSVSWLQTGCVRPGNCDQADIDRNGTVELMDIQILAEHWLEGL